MVPPLEQVVHQVQVTPSNEMNEKNEEEIDFNTSNGMMLWHALSKNNYGKFQPIAELIDNAISAIQQKTPIEGSVHLRIDFDTNQGSVEHRGGVTFSTTKQELHRIFSYGGKKPTKLNEHGCGIKTSLAILNPDNNSWKIEIKREDDSVYSIEAPYGDNMRMKKETNYSGMKGSHAGSFIRFPISKDRFQDLYRRKVIKMTNLDELHNRIQQEMSHFWMMNENIKNKNIKLYYNDILIHPFSFREDKIFDAYVEKIENKSKSIENGAYIQIDQIELKEDAKKGVKGSNWFKYALNSNGLYLYKNGRFIEAVNGDDDRKLYTRFIGNSPHNGHNGKIALVNMVGEQDQLPPTTPTKNRFPDSPELESLIKVVNEQIDTSSNAHVHRSEEQRVAKFKEDLEKMIKMIPGNPYPNFRIEQEKIFKLHDSMNSPPLDLVVTYNTTMVQIFEAKDSPVIKPEYFQQLHFYWLHIKKAKDLEGKDVTMNLLCNLPDDWKPSENIKYYIDMYKEAGLEFGIWNFKTIKFDV